MELIKFSIRRHPYFSAFYLWLYLLCTFGWFSADKLNIFNIVSSAALILALIPMNELFIRKRNISRQKNTVVRSYLLIAAMAAYSLLTVILYSVIPKNKPGWGRNAAVIFVSGIILLSVTFLYFRKRRIISNERILILVLLAGFFCHFYFNVYSEFNIQVDLQFLSTSAFPEGHRGYIEYLYNNFIPLQSDPRAYWQFYHPPLHHYLEALLLRIETLLGTDPEVAIYNIKFLPMLYYMLMTVTVKKIAELLKIKDAALIYTMAIVVFSPGFVFISNYANNDMLSVLLMIQSIYLAVLWYKDRGTGKMLLTALCFGAAMNAKLSSWMAAVPIAVFFIAALVEKLRSKDLRSFGRYFAQMCGFMLIAAPLSFYWSLRNYLRFGVPIGYIPEARDSIQKDSFQIINEPALQRLFDFSPFQFATAYENTRIRGTYAEYNPLIGLLKTSSADLYIEKALGSPFDMLNLMTFWITCGLAVAAFVFMLYILFRKGTIPAAAKIAMILFYIVILVSYYVFCIKYPMVCTEDIRYASPLILIGAACVGIVLSRLSGRTEKKHIIIRRGTEILVSLFCAASFLSFTADGLWTALYFNFR